MFWKASFSCLRFSQDGLKLLTKFILFSRISATQTVRAMCAVCLTAWEGQRLARSLPQDQELAKEPGSGVTPTHRPRCVLTESWWWAHRTKEEQSSEARAKFPRRAHCIERPGQAGWGRGGGAPAGCGRCASLPSAVSAGLPLWWSLGFWAEKKARSYM